MYNNKESGKVTLMWHTSHRSFNVHEVSQILLQSSKFSNAFTKLAATDAPEASSTSVTVKAPRAVYAVNTLDTFIIILHNSVAHSNSPGENLSNIEVFWWGALSSIFGGDFDRLQLVSLVFDCIKHFFI